MEAIRGRKWALFYRKASPVNLVNQCHEKRDSSTLKEVKGYNKETNAVCGSRLDLDWKPDITGIIEKIRICRTDTR